MSVSVCLDKKFATQENLLQLKNEIDSLKKSSVPSSYPHMCSGPAFFNSCLIALIMICVIGIVLSALGLSGVFPQFLSLFGASNIIWIIVSSSIIAIMSAIFSVCMAVFCSKYHPKIELPSISPEFFRNPINILN